MEIKEVTEKSLWEKALDSCENVYFPQSWNWGEVEIKKNHEPIRLAVYEDKKLVSAVQLIHVKAKRGNYLEAMLGPVFTKDCKDRDLVFTELIKFTKKYKADFLRIGPPIPESEEVRKEFMDLKFKKKIGQNQGAESTLIINLHDSEDEILGLMRKNTRYYIRRAEKDGVKIKIFENENENGIKDFISLYNETLDRVGFVSHKGIEDEFNILSKDKQAVIITAYYDDIPLSSGVFVMYRDYGVYHHGATSMKMPKIPASYAMLWEAIKYAKRNGKLFFSLWGVVGDDQTKHPWYGFSRFKRGFSENEIHYIRMQDYPFNLKYRSTRLYEKFEGWRKGY
ncbi:peptidoglycan bridge formation glycyltransferase FemA/FemB family protein [Candidatus Dojkabacteria bacterium]|uniref:Peptidoglycan bridge formation glycyltransferase FemA/FemB family protein n=1 Tax=Candidatus Dojkabacteria bacterium TaxID=2099670 RepID=A0A955RI57_9BACT|nr:peptidoglycan bridge formation glycyltransferase FemA/FemB family protein [Candidatus Dojkabacteria bacterium]